MEEVVTPRILISGVQSQVGKTLFALALAAEFRRLNLSAAYSLTGPDLMRGTMFRRATGRAVHVLDQHLLSSSQLMINFHLSGAGADLAVMVGESGLFDRKMQSLPRGSDAEIASLLQIPTVLVIDVRGYGPSMAAVLRGAQELAASFDVPGVCLAFADRVLSNGEFDREFYDDCFDEFRLRRPFGILPEVSPGHLVPSRLISQDRNEAIFDRSILAELADAVRQHVDVPAILAAARRALPVPLANFNHRPSPRRVRIAVTDDPCFSLGFQDNLTLLRYFGAEIVPFSPLADRELPKRIGAVCVSGCFLEEYAPDLAQNEDLARSIRRFVDAGGVLFSEGAGTAYLCEEFYITSSRQAFPGVGLITGRASSHTGQVRYSDGIAIEESVLGAPGLILKGVMTDEWRLASDNPVMRTLRVTSGSEVSPEGFSPNAQVVCNFMFTHLGSNPAVAKNLVDAAEIASRQLG